MVCQLRRRAGMPKKRMQASAADPPANHSDLLSFVDEVAVDVMLTVAVTLPLTVTVVGVTVQVMVETALAQLRFTAALKPLTEARLTVALPVVDPDAIATT